MLLRMSIFLLRLVSLSCIVFTSNFVSIRFCVIILQYLTKNEQNTVELLIFLLHATQIPFHKCLVGIETGDPMTIWWPKPVGRCQNLLSYLMISLNQLFSRVWTRTYLQYTTISMHLYMRHFSASHCSETKTCLANYFSSSKNL